MDKVITAVEPFAISMILLAGASMTHWISFTNSYVVGLATVFCGIMLVFKHIYLQIKKG